MKSRHTLRLALIILVLIVVVASVAVLFAYGWAVTSQLLSPKDHWGRHPDTAYGVVYRKYPELEAWHDSIAARGEWRDTTLVNDRGLTMHAIYVPREGATATAIVCHGYTDSAPIMMRYTYLYNHELGMNTLMPEWQYHGTSEGDYIQMGWMDRFDALRFAEMAHAIWPDAPMVMHGISMGASTVLCAAGEGTPPYVRGIIADCGFTTLREEYDFYFCRKVELPWVGTADRLPSHPFTDAASIVSKLRYGWSFDDADALGITPRIKVPVFFIHGDEDPMVPVSMVYRLYDAKATGERRLWIPPSTKHARSIHEHWTQYVDSTRSFVNNVLW